MFVHLERRYGDMPPIEEAIISWRRISMRRFIGIFGLVPPSTTETEAVCPKRTHSQKQKTPRPLERGANLERNSLGASLTPTFEDSALL